MNQAESRILMFFIFVNQIKYRVPKYTQHKSNWAWQTAPFSTGPRPNICYPLTPNQITNLLGFPTIYKHYFIRYMKIYTHSLSLSARLLLFRTVRYHPLLLHPIHTTIHTSFVCIFQFNLRFFINNSNSIIYEYFIHHLIRVYYSIQLRFTNL